MILDRFKLTDRIAVVTGSGSPQTRAIGSAVSRARRMFDDTMTSGRFAAK